MKKIGLFKAIRLTYKADKMTNEERYLLQQKRLKELVSFAKTNSPYFAKLYQNVDENAPLTSLPATDKIEMMTYFDEWLTDRSISKDKVDRFMADLSNVGRKIDGKYLVIQPLAQQVALALPYMMIQLSMYRLLLVYYAALPENRI